jgi:gliding motility-associated-like protein
MHSYHIIAQEICNNGKDDDGNGLTDLFDPACQCHLSIIGNLLLNASFESYNHCPIYYTYDQDYKIANYWQFGSNSNDAEYYHNLNCTSDSAHVLLKMPPALPMPQGKGFISIYNANFVDSFPENQTPKTYVGQCLQNPLQKGGDYTLSFYAGRFRSWDNLTGKIFPFTVAVFGNADCNAVPFGPQNEFGNGCPANYKGWTLLGKTTMYSSGDWVQGKIRLTIPYDIHVIEIGPDCSVLPNIVDQADSTTFLDYHLYYLDDLHLLQTKDFHLEYIHTKTGINCNDLPVLQAPVFTNAVYQWYKDSIAIGGATSNIYSVADTTGVHYYNVTITTNDTCITTEPFLVTPSQLNKIKIPADTILCKGDTLLLSPALDGISYNINGIANNEVIIDKPGNYQVTATDINGCQKIFNSNVAEGNCTDCDMFVPTAFTPNGDGLNDMFIARLYCVPKEFHCRIFNRWGETIFESNDINKGWNGRYSGILMPSGSYVYYIVYKTSSGMLKTAKGVVTLIK